MKKKIFIIAAMACGMLAAAQDTLLLSGPKNSYFAYNWPINAGDTIKYLPGENTTSYYNYIEKDSLTIYGIAASLKPSHCSATYNPYADTSLESVSATLRLYKRTSNQVYPISEDQVVWLADPPTFYLKLDVALQITDFEPHEYQTYPVYPVYERYFDTPVTVTGEFYVGADSPLPFNENTGGYNHRYAVHNGFCRLNQNFYNLPCIYYVGPYLGTNSNWGYMNITGHIPYIFPILTPLPDTTAAGSDTTAMGGDTIVVIDTLLVGGDTVIIGGDTIVYYDTIVTYDTIVNGITYPDNDMLARLTGVMPNPAASTAKVVSSFGLTRIEVYSSTGARVYDRPAVGLAATLDVSRWPSGTYMVRIHTPMGVATKRLAVAR